MHDPMGLCPIFLSFACNIGMLKYLVNMLSSGSRVLAPTWETYNLEASSQWTWVLLMFSPQCFPACSRFRRGLFTAFYLSPCKRVLHRKTKVRIAMKEKVQTL